MYPLVHIGPLRLSSGGLFLLLAFILANWLATRVARARGGAQQEAQVVASFYPVLLGLLIGGRLWYGIFNWDVYSRTPALFWALQFSGFAWTGALLGGLGTGYLWCRLRRFDALALGDSVALALPVSHVVGDVGLLLSGETFGLPTALPWGIPLFGTLRHPTQIYLMLAAIGTLIVLIAVARRTPPSGTLLMVYLGLQGLTMLLVEALRADSLVLPGGLRVAQIVGLGLILLSSVWLRHHPVQPRADPPVPHQKLERGYES
ncbi:MAG: hypothetical protein NVSMB42_18630 [Herpetosiphon sp.]